MPTKRKKAVRLDENMLQCQQLLKFMQARDEAKPFLSAVDWQQWGLMDYPEIIKTPMDLGTIQKKLEGGQYTDVLHFGDDVRLVWKNAQKYNRADSDIYADSEKLSKVFEKKFTKIKPERVSIASPSKLFAPVSVSAPSVVSSSSSGRGGAHGVVVSGEGGGGGEEVKRPRRVISGSSSNSSKDASRNDRIRFTELVQRLTAEELGQLISRLKQEYPDALNEEDPHDVVIEVLDIPGELLLQLNASALKCIESKGMVPPSQGA